MREVLKKEALRPAASLRFLYGSRLGGLFLRLLVCRPVSKVVGCFLDSRFSRILIRRYVRKHKIDMSLYEKENYKSFNAFFTRRIRSELRPFDHSPEAFVSPCDAKLSVFSVDEGSRFEIKGFSYSVESLLRNKALANRYRGGQCLVFRLTVEDYHRYFYIDDGIKGENVFIRGKLHTVQPAALGKAEGIHGKLPRIYDYGNRAFRLGDAGRGGRDDGGRIVNNDGAAPAAAARKRAASSSAALPSSC